MRDMVNVTSAGVSMGSAVSTGGSMGNVLSSMGSVAGVNVSGGDTVVREDSGNVRGSGVVPSPGDGEGTPCTLATLTMSPIAPTPRLVVVPLLPCRLVAVPLPPCRLVAVPLPPCTLATLTMSPI